MVQRWQKLPSRCILFVPPRPHTHTHTHTYTQCLKNYFLNLKAFGLCTYLLVCLIAQLVKNLPAMQETPIRFLGWEDPLEKE